MSKLVYIKENQLYSLKKNLCEEKEEVTFYEFIVGIKQFMKDLLKSPNEAKPSDIFAKRNIDKNELVKKMMDWGLLKSKEEITEVPVEEGAKMVAKHYISYQIPKARFKEKAKELYNELFVENYKPQVFKETDTIINNIISMDDDNAYKDRGGYDKDIVTEDGEGATNCGSVMQDGGGNPSAGQYDAVAFNTVQKGKFFNPALKRKKGGSISINR